MKVTSFLSTSALVFAVLIVSVPQSSAQTMYACVNNKTSAMRYAAGPGLCSKTERQISWPAGPPTGVKVYDADENYLCDLVRTEDSHVDLESGGGTVSFEFQFFTCFIPSLQSFMSLDRFAGQDRWVFPVYFEATDPGDHTGCQSSQQPWVQPNSANTIFRDGNGDYYKPMNVNPEPKLLLSYIGPQPTSGCNARSPELPPLLVVPAERIAPPFAFPVASPLILK